MHKYSICACVRITNPFVFVEWLYYQFLIGFDHIYLYDNKSSFSMTELSHRYKDKVTIYHTDEDGIQYGTYNHFLAHHRNETEYVLFLDDDEFINFNDEFSCIDDIMKHMEYPDYLILNWIFMGCEKRVRNCSEYLIESNKKSYKEYAQENDQIKVLVKTDKIKNNISNAHVVNASDINYIKDGCNDKIILKDKIIYSYNKLRTNPMIWINHYYKMSRNEFLLKCERGKADQYDKRDFNEEFKYDENLIEIKNMDRWIEKIKEVAKTPLDLLEYSRTIDFDKSIRILNLILYNENEEYERQMKKELEKYLKKFEFVSFYFITFRDQEQNIEIENNCFYLKGKEGFIPQCLDKTLIALEYFLNKSFDYIVRSNISTIINFNYFPFKEKLQNIYSGCVLHK